MKGSLAALAIAGVVAALAMFALSSYPVERTAFFKAQDSIDLQKEFLHFIVKYGKHYSTKHDYLYRLSIFKETFEFVNNF